MCYRFSITVLLGLTLWVDSGQFLARDRNSCFVSRVNLAKPNSHRRTFTEFHLFVAAPDSAEPRKRIYNKVTVH